MEKIINAHCHIYPQKIAARAVEGIKTFYGLDRSLNGMTDDLIKDGSKVGVTHYLVHSVATKPSQVRSINEFISYEVKTHAGMFTGFGALHPDSEDIEGDLKHLLELGLKGVKIHPDFQGFALDGKKAFELGAVIRDAGIPVLIHCGDKRYSYSNPDQLIPFIKSLPGLTIIAAHFAGWSVWDEAYEKVAGRYDILVDSCSSLYAMTPERACDMIRRFGADKVLWGTDYPMWEHEPEMEMFNRLDLSESERRMILYDNAAKLLGVNG